MSKVRKILSNEQGAMAIIMAAAILMLMAFSGLVIDSGYLVYQKSRLDAAANESANAIIQAIDIDVLEIEGELMLDPDLVMVVTDQFLKINMPSARIVELKMTSNASISLVAEVEVKPFFSNILGIEKMKIRSEAVGKVDLNEE